MRKGSESDKLGMSKSECRASDEKMLDIII